MPVLVALFDIPAEMSDGLPRRSHAGLSAVSRCPVGLPKSKLSAIFSLVGSQVSRASVPVPVYVKFVPAGQFSDTWSPLILNESSPVHVEVTSNVCHIVPPPIGASDA